MNFEVEITQGSNKVHPFLCLFFDTLTNTVDTLEKTICTYELDNTC